MTTNCAGGLYLAGEFLYFLAENHGFSFAYAPTSGTSGNMVRVNRSRAPGFRAGLGWTTPNDFWDVFLNYTRYSNHSRQTNESSLGFIPLWPVSDSASGEYFAVISRAPVSF